MPDENDKNLSVQERHSKLLKVLTHKNIENLPICYLAPKEVQQTLKDEFSLDDKYIALCTVSKLEEKDMPIDTAVEIINKINKTTDYKIIFLGAGKKCVDYAQKLQQAGVEFIDAVNKTTIPELAHILKLSSALISVDTGTMHMGSATDTPTVAVFYKRDMAKAWAPNPEIYKTKLITTEQTADNILAKTLKLIGDTNDKESCN